MPIHARRHATPETGITVARKKRSNTDETGPLAAILSTMVGVLVDSLSKRIFTI
jgi:hypothetical protein